MDWLQFFNARHIPTSKHGHTAGNIGVQCPWCGGADAGFHLGVALDGRGYHCWRDPTHGGRDPARLVAALLQCSYAEAARLVGRRQPLPDDFLAQVRANLEPRPEPEPARTLCLPASFRPVSAPVATARPFQAALVRQRGYPMGAIKNGLGLTHGLRYAIEGPFRYRIIFPVHEDGRLVTWTGRTIGTGYPRYKTLTTNAEKANAEGLPAALGPITNFLLWRDELLRGGDTLVITEGPFDALRVRWLGTEHGITATCLFTAGASERQIDLLHEVAPRFRRCILLLDQDTLPNMLRLQSVLASLEVTYKILPRGIKDPGELTSFCELRDILLA